MFKRAVFRHLRRIVKTTLFALLGVFVLNSPVLAVVFSPNSQQVCAVETPGVLTSADSTSFRALWCHECSQNALNTTNCNLTVNNGECLYGNISCKEGYENLHTEGEGGDYNSVCDKINYKITYNSSVDEDFDTNPNPSTYTIEDNIVFAAPTLACHTFKAWYTTENYAASSKITEIPVGTTGNKDLFAKWTLNSYFVRYKCGNPENQSRNEHITCGDSLDNIPRVNDICSYYGYTTDGWLCVRTDNNEDVSDLFEEQGYIQNWNIDSNVDCTAQVHINEYPIVYKTDILGYETVFNGLTPDSYTVADMPKTISANTTTFTNTANFEGYAFYGWCTEKTKQNCSSNLQIETPNPLGPITLWADLRLIDYNITYNLNGGTNNVANPQTYTIKDNVVLATPTKPGYLFVGWSLLTGADLEAALADPNNDVFIGGWNAGAYHEDIVLYAQWTPDTYEIDYYLNDGSFGEIVPKTEYNVTDEFTLAEPTKDGYSFVGWCEEYDNCGNPENPKTISSGTTGNLVFFAQWEAMTFNVDYICNDGIGVVSTDSVVYNTKYDFIDNTETNLCANTGHDFVGWNCEYKDENNNSVSLPAIDKEYWDVPHNVACSATWAESSFVVSFRPNSGPGLGPAAESVQHSDEMEDLTCLYNVGCVLPQNLYVYSLYDFAGWKSGDPDDATIYNPGDVIKQKTEDVILYTQWDLAHIHCEAGTYLPKQSLSCETCPAGAYCQGGNWTYSRTRDQGIDYCSQLYFVDGFNDNATSLEGSESENDCFIPCYTATNYVLDPEHNVVHYDEDYSVCIYKATIVYTGNNSCRNQQQTYTYSRTGYVNLCVPKDENNQDIDAFVGWKDKDDKLYQYFENISMAELKPENGIVTMTPVWQTYNLTYDCGTDNKTVVVPDLDYASNITLADYSICENPGHTFAGWLCDDVDVLLRSGDTYIIPDKNVLCSAQIDTNSYTIKFNKTAENAEGSMQDISLLYSDSIELPSNAYTRTGYNFAGWCDNWNNSLNACTGRTYSNQQTVRGLVAQNGGVITLYAMWSPIKYTINYIVPSGATFSANNPKYYYITTPTITLNNPELNGYNFIEWCDDNNSCSSTQTVEQGTTGDLTFTAHMEEIVYNIYYNYVDENKNVVPLSGLEPSTYTMSSGITLPVKDEVVIPGYTFVNWYIDKNLVFGPFKSITNHTGDINIYAKVNKLSCATNEFMQDGSCVPCGVNSYSNGGYATECTCNDNYEKQSNICVAKEYTINYELNGGNIQSDVNPVVYTVETPDTVLQNPTHETSAFQGWYKTSNFSGGSVTHIPGNLTGDLTLYAKWKKLSCNKNYYIKNGSCVPCSTYSDHSHSIGGSITACECDDGYEKIFDTCVLKNFAIEYVLNGGTLQEGITNPVSYTINSTDTVLNNPEKTNAVFAGWYAASDFSGDRIMSVPGDLSGNDITLYAKWQDDLGTATITYDCDNGNIISRTEHIGLDVALADNSECQISDNTLTGWTCDGTAYALTDRIVVPDRDINCVAIISNKYDIIYKAFDSNNNEIDLGVLYPNKYVSASGATLPENITIPGYSFGGWYNAKNLVYRIYNISKNSVGTKTVYAKLIPQTIHCDAGKYLPIGSLTCATCEENKYCVGGDYQYSTVISQGESDCVADYPYSVSGTKSVNRCYKNCEPREHYESSGSEYRNGLSSCKYTPVTYYINYVLNDGTLDDNFENPQPYNVTMSKITSLPVPVHPTKAFDKWTDENDSQITSILTSRGGNITLYAHYKAKPCEENQYMIGETCTACPTGMYSEGGYVTECDCKPGYTKENNTCEINVYNITYTGLEGTTHTNPSTYTVEDAGLRFLPPTNRDGYLFAGWTRQGMAYGIISQGQIGDMTLVANWEIITCSENEYFKNNTCVPCGENSHSVGGQSEVCDCNTGYETLFDVCVPSQYSIDYIYNGGVMPGGANNPASYTVETPITTLKDPTKQHYTFAGWFNNEEFSGKKIISLDPSVISGNITLYAKWDFACESGKWLRVGKDRICLYSEKQTSPSMAIEISGVPYYIMLSDDEELPIHQGSTQKMHIDYDGIIYNAHDASIN